MLALKDLIIGIRIFGGCVDATFKFIGVVVDEKIFRDFT